MNLQKSRPASLISWVLHPLWTPLYLFGILVTSNPYLYMQPAVSWYMGVVLTVSVLASIASLLMMQRSRGISDLEVSERKERFAPFAVVLLYQGLALWTLTGLPAYIPAGWIALLTAQMVLLAVALLITTRFKASMHMMGITGAFGVLIFFNRQHALGLDTLLPLGFLLAGGVAWARLRIGVHSLPEVLVGSLLGFFGMPILLGILL